MRAALLIGLMLTGALAVGLGVSHLLSAPTPASTELSVEQRLRCPQCTGIRLDVCDRPICQEMRSDIRQRLAAGESGDGIVASYAEAYGSGVVVEPSGFDAASVWLSWLAVGMGFMLLLLVGLRLRKPGLLESPQRSIATPRVDAELARWRSGK